MIIIDLDMDLFVEPPVQEAAPFGQRLNPENHKVWSEDEVRRFIENQCGLSIERRIPGRVITRHHEAYFFWENLIDKGILKTQFEVVHADAHADLGADDNSHILIMEELIHLPLQNRVIPQERVRENNYLAFALSRQWISKLSFVHERDGTGNRPDINNVFYHFEEFEPATNRIQLKGLREGYNLMGNNPENFVLTRDPSVPFNSMEVTSYEAEKTFDYIVLCQSPEYTTAEVDPLNKFTAKLY